MIGFAEVDLQTHRVHWSLYTNRHEINYYKYGYYTPRISGDGIDDIAQLKRVIGASKEFMGPELAKRLDEMLTTQGRRPFRPDSIDAAGRRQWSAY